jgi:hypothetical protein
MDGAGLLSFKLRALRAESYVKAFCPLVRDNT